MGVAIQMKLPIIVICSLSLCCMLLYTTSYIWHGRNEVLIASGRSSSTSSEESSRRYNNELVGNNAYLHAHKIVSKNRAEPDSLGDGRHTLLHPLDLRLNIATRDLDRENAWSVEASDEKGIGELQEQLSKPGVTNNPAWRKALAKVLEEELDLKRMNLSKLITTFKFVKYVVSKGGRFELNDLKNVLSPQNFDGVRFKVENGMPLEGKLEKLKQLENSINLTLSEINLLERAKPKKVKYPGQDSKPPALNLFNDSIEKLKPWQIFQTRINRDRLYEDDVHLQALLHDLSTQKIVNATEAGGGTQVKIVFTLANGGKGLFKPRRFPIVQERKPDHFYFSDYERYNSEIAASHLDRVLGLYRSPPVIGRMVNITRDIKPFASKKLKRTFFVSAAGNTCFYGTCSYYCDAAYAICGRPDMVEGSLAAFLPSSKRKRTRSPWRRSYSKIKSAIWEYKRTYCSSHVINQSDYNTGRRLLDLSDLSISDFLIGNLDRHHFEYFSTFKNTSSLVHYDHGRGFGFAYLDTIDILAPLYQCCRVRYSLLQKLLKFYKGPIKLSDAMKKMGGTDPLAPVLTEPHYLALDRRVKIVLNIVHKCIVQNGGVSTRVIIDDSL